MGNGLSGGLLWGKGSEVRLSLDRGDLWDLRPHPSYTDPAFTYKTVVDMAQAGRTNELNKKYSKPNVFPTKVPGARLVIQLPAGVSVAGFSLDLRRAAGAVELRGAPNATPAMDCFFSATEPVAMMKIPGSPLAFKLMGNPCFKKDLGFEDAEIGNGPGNAWLVQRVGADFSFAIHVQAQSLNDHTLLAISITSSRDVADPLALARKRTAAALAKGFEPLRQEHEAWWTRFLGEFFRAASRSGDSAALQSGAIFLRRGLAPGSAADSIAGSLVLRQRQTAALARAIITMT